MDGRFRIADFRLMPGCSAGLAEPTALVDIDIGGQPTAGFEQRLHAAVSALGPDQPQFRLGEPDWPAGFLAGPAGSGPPHRLAAWIIALTVAVQQGARSPVWRGRAVLAEPGWLRLAVPWRREELLRAALDHAVRLVEHCSAPESGATAMAEILDRTREFLSATAASGMTLDAMRYLRAATDRDIPIDIRPGGLHLGWGAAADRMLDGTDNSTSMIGILSADGGLTCNRLLAAAGLPVPGDPPLDGDDHSLLVVEGRLLAAVRRAGHGDTEDVTGRVHPDNRALAERAARVVGLNIAGVELRTPDIARPWREVGAAIRTVNARMQVASHWPAPDRDLHGEVLDALFAGRPARIPTAAITGTNGKSTTSLMLQHIWTAAGRQAGVCTTQYVRIGDDVISTKHLAGFPGARMLLNDPAVEVAIMEMPRKGLIIFGHACDRYDVAALLNIQDDHLGNLGIDTLEQMAELKSEVLQRARDAVVVNGDDPRCVAMLDRAGTDRHILVSRNPDSVAGHLRAGGAAVVLAERDGEPWIMLCDGDTTTALLAAGDIPATMGGLLQVNQSNAMFAAALAWAQGVAVDVIRAGLVSFHNTIEQNPGRFNFIDGLPFAVLLDNAHNLDGVREVCDVVDRIEVSGRRTLCSLTIGNPGPRQYVELAQRLSCTFDGFVVGCNPASVHRNRGYSGTDQVVAMLNQSRRILQDNGVPADCISTEGDPFAAVRLALRQARPGDLVVLLGNPPHVLPVIGEFTSDAG